jgi:hypothetical protein
VNIRFIVFITLFFFIPVNGLAQKLLSKSFELEWQGTEKVVLDSKTIWHLPYFQKATIDYDKQLPYFFDRWEISFNSKIESYTINNIVYENLLPSEIGDLKINSITENIQLEITALSERSKSYAYISLYPFVKNGNQIQKITSFTLNYTLKKPNITGRNMSNTTQSVLSSGEWYKIKVDTTGVYKIDRSFLSNLGINVNGVDPNNIQVYGNGGGLLPYRIGDFRYDDLQENAIHISGAEDNSFDSEDYILFYARGPEKWIHNGSATSLSHVKNIYDDSAYYFIHIGSQSGKRISTAPDVTGTPVDTYTTADVYWVHEKDQYNLFQTGQQFLGERFDFNNEQVITYAFDNLDVSSAITIKTRAVAASGIPTSMEVKLNNNLIYNLGFSATTDHVLATSASASATTNVNSEQLSITCTYDNSGNASAQAFLDYIEIIGKRQLIADNKQFTFRNFEALNISGTVGYSISNASNIFQVWDVTDPINVNRLNNLSSGNQFEFNATGGTLKEYVVVNENDFYTPTRPDDYRVTNQNIHGITQADYLILTHQDYISYAEEFAQFHRDTHGLEVVVVPLYKIYNEFGSGSKDITAIRDFVKHVYDQSSGQLKHLLLYGDASFDFKGLQTETSIVPAFQSYKSFNMTTAFVTDDFFGIVSDVDEGDLDVFNSQSQDVATARLPFTNALQAGQLNNKLINYYGENSFGDWRNEIVMIADDIDKPSDEVLQISQEALTDNIKQNKPLINTKKMWMDAFDQVIAAGGSRYPEVNTNLSNYVERGTLLVDYFGHGGEDGLALERILETDQIENWGNFNTLNLFMVISCEFARFDNPLRPETAGELVIRNPNGGAAHQIATTREVFISVGQYFNNNLIPKLLEYNNESFSISENMRQVKNTYSSKQRYFIYNFGDPYMKLAIPKPDVKITHMNGTPVTQSLDTISALSHISFDGIVTLPNGNVDTNFNGEVYLTVFDKPQDKQTLNNDGNAEIMTFDTQESKLFRGRASVTSGQFHIEFVAPQDLRIAYGQGKLSFYAHNHVEDRGGYNTDIIVGGINENAAEDNQGPQIRLYMNDTSFIDGGNTNQSPLFLAFLEDENGINTSLSSVDHDITAILDDDQLHPLILNDYYITDVDDYTKGSLEYRLRDLEIGLHTIKLKAYDTYNNASEALLNFVVVDDAKLLLEHVLNYPNPFINYTEFWFNHNKPNEPLEVQIQIFTVSGKLVKTINQTVQNSGSLSREISWNGLDDFGQKIGKGVYVFKLYAHAPQSGLKAEKYEKLVILQ